MKSELCSTVLVETNQTFKTISMKEKLTINGYPVLASYTQIDSLASIMPSLDAGLLVLSLECLNKNIVGELTKLQQTKPLPIIVIAQRHAPEVIGAAVAVGVNSYVVDDIAPHRLPVLIDVTIERFRQLDNLNTALKETKEKLTERKLIAKAKGILMQQKCLSEEQAYVQMRKSAMNQGQSMAVLSKQIISVFEMLE